jgi:hypothetical protein
MIRRRLSAVAGTIAAEIESAEADEDYRHDQPDPADRMGLPQFRFPAGLGHAALHRGGATFRQAAAGRETTRCHRDAVTQGSLADAEIAEDDVEDVLDVDAAGETAQRLRRPAQLLGQEVLAAGELR